MKGLIPAAAVFSMLSSISIANASECKYEKNQIDLFTKERQVLTKWDELTKWSSEENGKPSVSVTTIIDGDGVFLLFGFKLTKTLGYNLEDA